MQPQDLPLEWRERYEERAAIIEEGCKVTPEEANRLAMMDITRQMDAETERN